ncbi:MAG: 4-hydroxy-tetrahydrodipicolinate reductase [Lachnospiraceae bacterium]|nr:4-hydroxy-tetrahydrodipicolinate reductase [Lachnospiraceae bacterium]
MIRILLHGCCGRMGRIISGIAAEDPSVEVIAGIDAFGTSSGDYPVYAALSELPAETVRDADVLIDFSTAAAMDDLFAFLAENKVPAVICTTGLSDAQMQALRALSEVTAVLKSANMSLGINLLEILLKEAASKLASAGFDIEIIEKHHNQKIDAPSGTAIALADAVNAGLEEPYEYVYDRSGRREKRPKAEIGISAVRGGSIVGDHDVLFAGQDEVITFSHRVYSRAVFGKGAVEAAKFLAGKAPGYYDMQDVLR